MNLFPFLLPSPCLSCGDLSFKKSLCLACIQKIKVIKSPQCTICGIPFEPDVPSNHPCAVCLQDPPAFHWSRSFSFYEAPLQKVLTDLKYENGFSGISFLSESIVMEMHEYLKEADYLIPVPLHTSKLKKRGYNQSILLAEKIAKKTKIPFLRNSLKRVIDTPPQVGLNREERIKNMKGAFVFEDKPELLQGKKLILIDDVTTTGATLNACAIALKKYSPQEIGCITVAYRAK